MELPPGKKPLRAIEQQSDAASRVIDLTILLDFALASLDSRSSDDRNASPSDRIKRNAERFTSLPDMMFAIGVRNDLVHATNAKRKIPGQREIKRAATILRRGLIEVVPVLGEDVASAIVRGSHVDPNRGKSKSNEPQKQQPKRSPTPVRATTGIDRKTLFLIVGSLLALLVLPPLLKRALHGSESATEPARRQARTGHERFESLAHVPGFEPEFDALEAEVNSGDHFWNKFEFRAAGERYAIALEHLARLEELGKERDLATRRRQEAEAAKNLAIAERAVEEAPASWAAAMAEFEAATHAYDKSEDSFGSRRFERAREQLEHAAVEAREHRAARAKTLLADAEAAIARGEVATALDRLLDAARDGDMVARERFDSLARTCPPFWTALAQERLTGEPKIELPDLVRALLALAGRNAKAPPEFAAPRLLASAYQAALRFSDPRIASDFLLSIARAQQKDDPGADISKTLIAAADALAVTAKDPEIVLRYAQLAALAESLADSSRSQTLMKNALEIVAASKDLSSLPEAIYLADLHRFDEALAKAMSLVHDPAFREFGEIALSWVAWRAAEFGNAEIERKARLAATESGIEGSKPRGGIALFQFAEAELALGRIDDADATRRSITWERMRAAADYALAEARARQGRIAEARALFDAAAATDSPFGAGAAAEIAAARLKDPNDSPFAIADWALCLRHDDLKAAAIGGAAQEIARALPH